MKRIISIFCFISIFVSSIWAQEVTYSGIVTDIETKDSIDKCKIRVYKGKVLYLETSSAHDGSFEIQLRTETTYKFEVTKLEYRKLVREIELGKPRLKQPKIKIYLEKEGLKCKGHVYDSVGRPLANMKIILFNNTLKLKKTLRTNVKGEYTYRLNKNQQYTLKLDTTIKGSQIERFPFSTLGVNIDQDIVKDFFLTYRHENMDDENAAKEIILKNQKAENESLYLDSVVSAPITIKKVIEPVLVKEQKTAPILTKNKTVIKDTSSKKLITTASISEVQKKDTSGIKQTLSIAEYEKKLKEGNLPTISNTNSDPNKRKLELEEGSELIYVKENTIFYPPGKAVLNTKAYHFLDDIISNFKLQNNKKLLIEIFSDANNEYTIKDYICRMRSEEIVKYCISKEVPFDKLVVSIVGNKVLANDCKYGVECTEEQHQENRRSRISVVDKYKYQTIKE